MDKYKKLLFTLGGIIILMMVCYNLHISVQQASKIEKIEQESLFKTILIENLNFTRQFEIQSEGTSLEENILIKDNLNKTVSIKEILHDKKEVLIFRFTEDHCDACILQQLNLLKDRSEKSDRLILLASYSNIRKVRALINTYNLQCPVYNLEEKLKIPIENLGLPYFFLVDDNLTCRAFSSVIKENDDIVESNLGLLLSLTDKE